MDFPRPSVSPSNIIGDLKDRFGFGGAKQRAYDEEPYYDEYDEYGYDDAGAYDSGDQYASSSQADPYDRSNIRRVLRRGISLVLRPLLRLTQLHLIW